MADFTPKNPIWGNIIKGEIKPNFEFFAVKIFLGSAQLTYKQEPRTLERLATELYTLYEKNQELPSAKKDITRILSWEQHNDHVTG